jgi:glycosyltransferase involved in cell wall biosynthesis
VVAVSRGVAQSVRSYYELPESKVMAIPNFVDPSRVARLAAESAPPFETGRFHVVAVGRLHAAKGYQYLLEAADKLVHQRALERLMVWIIGRGPQLDELKSWVRQNHLDSHVQFTGYLANPLPFVEHAQLFCLPSLYEGMPNALIEAMLLGTPVLASDCPSGPSELLEGGRYGRLVPPGDSAALADALAEAVTDHAVWQQRAEGARRHAESVYSLSAGMTAWEELFREVAGECA